MIIVYGNTCLEFLNKLCVDKLNNNVIPMIIMKVITNKKTYDPSLLYQIQQFLLLKFQQNLIGIGVLPL